MLYKLMYDIISVRYLTKYQDNLRINVLSTPL